MRPAHWIKNMPIFAGLIFSHNLFNVEVFLVVATGFILFDFTASGIYIFNDIVDMEKDRQHPEKRNRPLASGNFKVSFAYPVAAILIAMSLLGAYFLNKTFFGILMMYIIMNVVYSLKVKQVVILDVMCIAFGFVFRVLAGTVLANVSPSDWLIICTITLSLFLGFSKRRHELSSIGPYPNNHRRVLRHYSISFLDQMIAVATACTVMSYALYTVSHETVARFGTRNLVYTIPFVLYGIFRYLYLIHEKRVGGNPTSVFLTDRPLLLNCLMWLLVSIYIVY